MKINIIYMAAGNSSRFGSNKLLYQYNGKPLFRYGLDVLTNVAKTRNDCRVIVATRYDEIEEYVRTLAEPAIKVCHSADSYLGASYTIRNALKSIERAGDELYYVFMVADEPNLTFDIIDGFLNGLLGSGKPAGSLVVQGQNVNPMAFSSKLEPELLSLENDEGGRFVFNRYRENCFGYEVDQRNVNDVDYLIDFTGLL